MAKYHINDNGEAKKCTAKNKCPFGDLTNDHYDTVKDARKAYEKYMTKRLKDIIRNQKVLNNHPKARVNTLINDKNQNNNSDNVKNINQFNQKSKFNKIKLGRISIPNSNQLEKIETFKKNGNELISNFLVDGMGESYDGYFDPPIGIELRDDYYDEELDEIDEDAYAEDTTYGDFKLIGSGVERNAYLHEKSGMVYKIPNAEHVASMWNEDVSITFMEDHIYQGENYSKIVESNIKEEYNIEYVESYYISAKDANETEIPIIVQKYLDPKLYDHHAVDRSLENELAQKYKLWDMHGENVRINRETGAIILLDCIDV